MPTAILHARGSWRAKRNKHEPLAPSGQPSCPDWISDQAQIVWRRIIPILESMNVLTTVDGESITRYCVTWARWKKCEEFLQEHGETYPVKQWDKIKQEYVVVGVKTFPQVRTANILASQLARLEQAFGLTPSARSRIEAPAKQDGSEKKEGTIKFFTAGA